MDPNATLDTLRALVRARLDGHDIDSLELAELVEALDTWLSQGGFLPTAWTDDR